MLDSRKLMGLTRTKRSAPSFTSVRQRNLKVESTYVSVRRGYIEDITL